MRVKLRSAQLTGKIFPFGPISIFFFHLPNEKLLGLKRQKGKKIYIFERRLCRGIHNPVAGNRS